MMFCRVSKLFPLLLLSASVLAEVQLSGHLKAQGYFTHYDSNSIYALQIDSHAHNQQADFRLNLSADFENYSAWDFNIDYQILADNSDPSSSNNVISESGTNDERRLFNLSHTLSEADTSVIHRLDRFNVGYTGEKFVLRFGRQALSWGSGLMFSVMDIVNPFDGRVYDQEYKVGDDILYLQYLFPSGNDAQFASVLRRNIDNNKIETEQHTFAGKYHGFLDTIEYDLLLAQHYKDELIALGLGVPIGGAVVYAELAYTVAEEESFNSGLVGVNYSWAWFAHNFSGALEFYHNDMGLKGDFIASDILAKPLLVERVVRGDLRLLAANYFAASTAIELHPLLRSSANVFYSLEDQSALLQLSASYEWQQNIQLFAAFAAPLGSEGGELSGLESEIPNRYFSNEYQALVKLAWYY